MKLSLKKKDTVLEKSPEEVSKESKPKKKMSKKRLRVISIILVIVIAVGGFFMYGKFFSVTDGAKATLTAVASVGSVSSVIEGSGTLEALQQYEITSLIKGEVVEDFFEEGDTVAKDDILYRMDNEAGLEAIDNAESSLKKARRSYEDATESISDLVVKSKSAGVITQMYIEVGDNVNANTKVADVIDNSNMILEIQFLSDYALAMTAGQSVAEVTLSKNGTVLTGKVTKVSTGQIINSVGAKVTNVEITVPNPGAIMEGDYATALVNGLACSSEGSFKNAGKSAIYTQVSGKVENLYIMTGDKVSYGQSVAVLSNDSLSDISETSDNYSDARNRYDDAVEALEDYVVKAPIGGKIIQKNIKAGEKMDNNSSSVMAIIADLSALVFQMSVDELDISKLHVGMDVEITPDAIENVTFTGKVTNISIVGSSNNGVTTYPVKITLNSKEEQTGMAYANYDKLIPGLNVSASVVIERVENVIVVPVSAVRRGNIVIVSKDSASEGIGMEAASRPRGSNFTFGQGGGFASDASPDKMMPSDGFRRPGIPGEGGINNGNNQSQRAQNPTKNANNQREKAENSPQNPNTQSEKNENPQANAQNGANDRLKNMLDSLDIPDGYKAIFVETGLSDERFIEIKSGLSEGDVVALPDTTASQNGNMGQGQMPGGMGGMGGMPGGMGSMRGGMPSGGNRMPSGGGNRGNMGGMR